MGGTWEGFKRKHVLNPEVDRGFGSWNKPEWNDWLRERVNAEYGSRRINSVVISSPEAILEDFETPGALLNSNFYWSRNKYRTFYLKLTNSDPRVTSYNVLDLGQMHFAAAVSNSSEGRTPVHFHGQSEQTQSRGNINIVERNYRRLP